MSIDIRHLGCCGFQELNGIRRKEHKDIIADVCAKRYGEDSSCAFYIFTDAEDMCAGLSFAKFVISHKLGSITRTPIATNPNSDNEVRGWVWKVNNKALNAYAQKNNLIYEDYNDDDDEDNDDDD